MARKADPNSTFSRIKNLGVGECITFPATKVKSIRTMCYELRAMYSQTYKTTLNVEAKTISATRIN